MHANTGQFADDVEPFTRMLYERAGAETGADVMTAMDNLELVCREVGEFFVDHDLLLTPTLGRPVPPLGLLDMSDVAAMVAGAGAYSAMTSQFNMTGQPGISLPLGTDSAGLPVGMQFVAAFGREDLLIRLAGTIESARPWSIAPVWPPRET